MTNKADAILNPSNLSKAEASCSYFFMITFPISENTKEENNFQYLLTLFYLKGVLHCCRLFPSIKQAESRLIHRFYPI